MIRASIAGEHLIESLCELASRSRIRNLNRAARSLRSMSMLRACWAVHAPVGCAMTPRICTRRVWNSITKNT